MVDATSTGRVCVHYSLQLSLNGTAVDVPCGHRVREYFCAEAVGARAAILRASAGAGVRGWSAGWCDEPGAWNEAGGGSIIDRSAGEGGFVRRIERCGEVRLCNCLCKRQARAGAGRREESLRRNAGRGYEAFREHDYLVIIWMCGRALCGDQRGRRGGRGGRSAAGDRKSTRLNSSHLVISYAVF